MGICCVSTCSWRCRDAVKLVHRAREALTIAERQAIADDTVRRIASLAAQRGTAVSRPSRRPGLARELVQAAGLRRGTHRQAAIVCFWLERTSRGVYRHVRLRPVSEAEWASQQPRQCCDFCGGPRSIPSFATMQRKTAIIPMPRLPTGISVRSMLLPYIARPLLSFTRNIR